MTRRERLETAAFLAAAAVGLIFDGTGLWRMTLLACALHEMGHVLVYVFCARRLPHLCLRAGGFALRGTERLSQRAEILVLMAGPLVNIIFALFCLGLARMHASYRLYFWAAVHLCVAVYNCLPLAILDGGRILERMVPLRYQGVLIWIRRLSAALLAALMLTVFLRGSLSGSARMALIVAVGYLLAQGLFADSDLW